jgi:hypothetical protein
MTNLSSTRDKSLARLLELHVHRRRLTYIIEELRDMAQPTEALERLIDSHRREATGLLADLDLDQRSEASRMHG